MKRYLFLFAICLFCGALAFEWLLRQPSYLMLVVGNTSIEMSVWLALGLMLSGLFLVWLAFRLAGGSWSVLVGSLNRALFGSESRVRRQQTEGLINYIEGNWKPALKQLTRSAPKSDEPLLNYIAAATSAFELGDEKKATELLAKADKSNSGAELAVTLTQARHQLRAKKYEQSAASLERARKLAPRHPVVLGLLSQVCVSLNDWEALEKLLPLLERYRVVPDEELKALKQQLYLELLKDSKVRESFESLQSRWNKIPTHWQLNVDVILEYCGALLEQNESPTAEALLRKCLHKHWDNRLVEYYGMIEGRDISRQLLEAENWLKERPNNAELLLALGRVALRNQLWGKAKDYFSSSLAIKSSPGAYAEMARLLAHLGEHKKSTEYYQQGLLNFSGVLPELPMPEKPETTR